MFWFGIFGWFILGTLIYCVLLFQGNPPYPTYRLNWVNPVYLYKKYEFTIFGSFILSLCATLLSPPIALFYWLTKKRKKSREK